MYMYVYVLYTMYMYMYMYVKVNHINKFMCNKICNLYISIKLSFMYMKYL